MLSQLHMAKSALFSFQRKMQLIANNISNAETVGFKKSRMEMESLFPLILEKTFTEFEETVVGLGQKRKKYMEYGQGVTIADVTKNFSNGTISITNIPLDMAIEGQGFFQVRLPDGRIGYSRAGNFHQDAEGNVVTPNGNPLEPSIRIPRNATEIIINQEGRVFVQLNKETQPREIGQITLATFPNPPGLKDIGQNSYVETVTSGEPVFELPGRNAAGNIRQRALEFSNVNVIEEMMDMVLTQRSFEVIVKSIQAADSMLKVGNDLGK